MLVWIFSSKNGINHGECNSDVRLMWLYYSLVSLVQDQSAEVRAQQTVHTGGCGQHNSKFYHMPHSTILTNSICAV